MDPLGERREVKRSMYRVSRLSVRELEVEHFRRGDAMAGSRQGHSGGSEVAEVETASWNEIGHDLISSPR